MAAGLPTAVTIELEFTAGVWTDISTSVIADSLEISPAGRKTPTADLEGGTLDLDLDNNDGTWVPDNPLSSRFPNFVEGRRIRCKVTKGTTSTRFVGRITTIEPDYNAPSPQHSRTHVVAIDAIGETARMQCPPTMLGAIKALYIASGEPAPTQSFWYWPLLGGYQQDDLITGAESLSYFQPGGGEVSWEADSSFPLGGPSCLSMTAGVGLTVGLRAHVPALLNAHRIGGAFRLETGAAGLVLGATDMKTTGALVTGVVVWWDGGGTLSVRQYTAGTPSTLVSVPVVPGWHTISLFFGSGAEALAVDGVDTSTGVLAAPPNVITIGGSIGLSVRDLYITSGTSLDSYLADTGASLATVSANVAAALRLADIDASLAWTSSVAGVRATAVPTHGRPGLDTIRALADSQSGIGYVAYSTSDPQPITLLASADSRPTVVALTLDAAADLEGGPSFDRNVYGKVGSATGKNASRSVLVVDEALAATFGAGSVEKESALALPNDLAASASDLIAQSKNSKLRIVSVTFDLATAANDLYSAFFALTPGERVRVANLASTFLGVTYLDGYVIGWTERPRQDDGYEVALYLAAADAPPEARYDDSTYGRYGWADGAATVTSGTAVGATGTGTLVITTPSGPCLTVAAGSYPLQLDWNGECVTITSAPASSTSPQTVTITARGQNGTVARVHAAGEPVDIWQSARFAL